MTIFSNRTIAVLEKALDGSSAKQKAIAHNVANINTPGFKSVQVSFKEQLKAALGASKKLNLRATDSDHISNKPSIQQVHPELTRNTSTSMRPDENNVDIDKEMTEMAANTIYNNAAISQLNKRLAILSYVITDGRS